MLKKGDFSLEEEWVAFLLNRKVANHPKIKHVLCRSENSVSSYLRSKRFLENRQHEMEAALEKCIPHKYLLMQESQTESVQYQTLPAHEQGLFRL